MDVIRRKLVLAVALTLSLLAAALGARTVAAQSADQTYALNAINVMQNNWYVPSSGWYDQPGYGWGTAPSLTALEDYEELANVTTFNAEIENSYNLIPNTWHCTNGGENVPFCDGYSDDQQWFAENWIKFYDLTNDTDYLTAAESIFTNVEDNYWDTTACGGGLIMTRGGTYANWKETIANELFIDIAAKLANRTTGSVSTGYATEAVNAYDWFNGSGLITSTGIVADGLDHTASDPSDCTADASFSWSYDQGVILAGLAELYYNSDNSAYLTQAETIANATLASPEFTGSTCTISQPNVLIEWNRCYSGWTSSDQSADYFKGIFMHGLMDLYAALPAGSPYLSTYSTFAQDSANAIVTYDEDGSTNEYGFSWLGYGSQGGGPDSEDSGRQTSAINAFIAAAKMQYPFINPQWLTGDLSGWTLYASQGSTSEIYARKETTGAIAPNGGFYRLQIDPDSGNGEFSGWATQIVTGLPQGKTFNFSVWARIGTGVGSNIGYVEVMEPYMGGVVYCQNQYVNSTTWTQITCSGTVSSSGMGAGKIQVRLAAANLPVGSADLVEYDDPVVTVH